MSLEFLKILRCTLIRVKVSRVDYNLIVVFGQVAIKHVRFVCERSVSNNFLKHLPVLWSEVVSWMKICDYFLSMLLFLEVIYLELLTIVEKRSLGLDPFSQAIQVMFIFSIYLGFFGS